MGTHHFLRVPARKHRAHNAFHVVEVLLGLERVVDAVVSRLVKFFIAQFRIMPEVGAPGSLDQAMRHQRTRRDDRVHDSPIDQLRDDQTLLGNGHGAGQGHHHETVLIARHRF